MNRSIICITIWRIESEETKHGIQGEEEEAEKVSSVKSKKHIQYLIMGKRNIFLAHDW